jgi:hypothetical protein
MDSHDYILGIKILIRRFSLGLFNLVQARENAKLITLNSPGTSPGLPWLPTPP